MKKLISKLIAPVLFAAACSTIANAQRITLTLTGTGIAGYSGDGGNCKLAQVSGPKDICIDTKQNVYFIDKANGRIREITAEKGIINTIAGGGGSVADGIPAITAYIEPNYMCVNTAGDIYFTSGNKVRKVAAATGTISTIAGTGTAGYTGDGGLAITATLSNPQGICIDAANNIYTVDRDNNCIRKIDAATGNISTIAGNGTRGLGGDGGPAAAAILNGPVCICVSPAGDIYFSDQNPTYPMYDNSIIREISAATGIVNTIAGSSVGIATFDVPALNATLGTTTGLYFCGGELYCNEMSCSCRKLNFVTDTLYLVGGNFGIESYSNDTTSPLANMNVPYGLCVDKYGTVYVADSGNQRIRKIIQLGHTPSFAYGHGLYIDPAIGVSSPLDSLMWITDIDVAQTETWSVVNFPLHGTLAGFPATAASKGDATTTKATGLSYTASSTYAGADFFRIRVFDGMLADTVTVYVGPNSSLDPLSVANTVSTAATMNIFPNPAKSVLNVQCLDTQAEPTDLFITDVAGRVFYNTSVPARSSKYVVQINIATLPAGVYFVKNGQDVSKFVKE